MLSALLASAVLVATALAADGQCSSRDAALVPELPLAVVWHVSHADTVEMDWIADLLLVDVNRRVRHVSDVGGSSRAVAADMVVVTNYLTDMAAWLRDIDRAVVQRLTVLYLSDESCAEDVSWAGDAAITRIYRNYLCPDVTADGTMRYLPLGVVAGFGIAARRRSSVLRASERRTPCFFGGQIAGPERLHLVSYVLEALPDGSPPPGARFNCTLFVTSGFKRGVDVHTYSRLMHDTALAFAPPGMSVDTFRLWEALEAGAIPVYFARPGQPHYIQTVSDCPVPVVHDFGAGLDAAMELLLRPDELDALQRRVIEWWRRQREAFVSEVTMYLDTAPSGGLVAPLRLSSD
jgi:hypothetical protein